MKKILILIFFGLLMFASYRYSGVVHRFYLKTYYNIMYTEDELLKRSWALYDDGKYEKLERFLEPLLKIYLWNNDLKRIAGLNYIKLGESVKGAELFSSSFENGTGETSELVKVLKVLFQNGNYGDVLFFYDRNIMRNNVNCAFYYGASLYYQGRYKEANQNFIYARNNGFIGEDIDYYTGINYEKLGDLAGATKFLLSAYEQNRFNREVKTSLIRVYRKSGNYEKAEFFLRSK